MWKWLTHTHDNLHVQHTHTVRTLSLWPGFSRAWNWRDFTIVTITDVNTRRKRSYVHSASRTGKTYVNQYKMYIVICALLTVHAHMDLTCIRCGVHCAPYVLTVKKKYEMVSSTTLLSGSLLRSLAYHGGFNVSSSLICSIGRKNHRLCAYPGVSCTRLLWHSTK